MTQHHSLVTTLATDALALLRSRSYIGLLVLAAIIGAPVSALAYGFLKLVEVAQGWVFTDLPKMLGVDGEPTWWPVLPLVAAGVLTALAIQYLPGGGGHSPADGFQPSGRAPRLSELPGIAAAALATLCLGVVLGPEMPLIAIGGGLGAAALRLAKRDTPSRAASVAGAAGSFAAISTLLGSPLIGAFLLMEATGIAGAALELVLIPGLLAAGIGSLVFVGLNAWTGWGTLSLAIPNLPHFARPDIAEFGWALAIGAVAAPLGAGLRTLALFLRPRVETRRVAAMAVLGLAIAGLAILFAETTGKSSSKVLFSGQSALGPLITQSVTYTVPALLLLIVCKGLAYGASLSSFRGGPVFPAMFIGAAGGIALSHLPGLPLVPAVAMGIGAMSVAMLKLPMTSVLLATLLLSSDGVAVMPLVIVAVAVAYVLSLRFTPFPAAAAGTPTGNQADRAPARHAGTTPGE